MSELIVEVTKLKLTNDGRVVTVTATGRTRSAGWSQPELVIIDDTFEAAVYEFRATPPATVSSGVLTEISAMIRHQGQAPKKVIVKAETNQKQKLVPR